MAKRKIDPGVGITAVRAVLAAGETGTDRQQLATAVRFLLEELAALAPGAAVEVRVPPFGATQCVTGPKHTRGTPPNVIECEPMVWIRLATGNLNWQQAVDAGQVSASGERATLAAILPIARL